MKITTLSAFASVSVLAGQAGAQSFVSFNDRSDFLAALDSTLIDDDMEQFSGLEVDFENSSVNVSSPGPVLSGYDVSHSGDEITTQFVDGTNVNGSQFGNTSANIQFLLDFAGVPGAFGATSNLADVGTITVETAGVNALGFDAFAFNDQGLSLLLDPQALGVEPGVVATVTDTLGNTQQFTISALDPFFGVVGTEAPIDTITFAATPTFASSGAELIAIDNVLGGTSSVPAPGSAALLAFGGLLAARRRRAD